MPLCVPVGIVLTVTDPSLSVFTVGPPDWHSFEGSPGTDCVIISLRLLHLNAGQRSTANAAVLTDCKIQAVKTNVWEQTVNLTMENRWPQV